MSLSIMSSSSVISLLWEGVYFSLFVMYVFLFKMRKYVNTGGATICSVCPSIICRAQMGTYTRGTQFFLMNFCGWCFTGKC
jgi:hypothetical protein